MWFNRDGTRTQQTNWVCLFRSDSSVTITDENSIVRASLGAMTTKRDVEAFVSFLQNQFIFKSAAMPLLMGSSNELPLREAFLYSMRNVSDMEHIVS